MDLRRWVQLAATVLTNAWWLFPFGGPVLYGGRLKAVCAPGFNCYSCPAAAAACPIGALQFTLASIRPGLEAGKYHFGLYVLGMLGTLGALAGRMPCAWLCPFGLLQELLHKIPSPELGIWRGLSPLKYVFLGLFVILLPALVLDEFGYGATWYCKYVCPAGTLEAGLPLLALKPGLRDMVGPLFYNKLAILALFLGWMVVSRRPFCRVACPLGAIYSLFNKVSVFRLTWDADKCVHCRTCERDCPMGVAVYQDPNQADCIRCLRCLRSCRYGAVGFTLAGSPPPLPDPARPAKTA